MRNKTRIILASKSAARQNMLRAAGMEFEAVPARIDEADIMRGLSGESAQDVASLLAREKALAVSTEHPDALVIGSDQVLVLDGELFTKASTVDEAKEKLRRLCGRTHELISAVCVAQGGTVLWRADDSARLRMRDFDADFLEAYAGKAGGALMDCVGAYALESVGAWLFDDVQGDHFTILGLPLLPLLGYLHDRHGVMP